MVDGTVSALVEGFPLADVAERRGCHCLDLVADVSGGENHHCPDVDPAEEGNVLVPGCGWGRIGALDAHADSDDLHSRSSEAAVDETT